jgi:hypothetical protein
MLLFVVLPTDFTMKIDWQLIVGLPDWKPSLEGDRAAKTVDTMEINQLLPTHGQS